MRSDYLNLAKKYLQDGEIQEALEFLRFNLEEITMLNHEYRKTLDKIINLSSDLNRLNKNILIGGFPQEEADKEKQIIVRSIFLIIRDLEMERLPIREQEATPMSELPPNRSLLISILKAPLALVKHLSTPKISGKIVYEAPSKMHLWFKELVTIRISHKSLKDAVIKNGLDLSKTKEEDIEISDVMEVALFEVGTQQNFDIQPLNNPEQVLNKKSYTEWQFYISAKRVGKFSLILRVSMKIHIPELGEKKKDIVTWSTAIEVNVGEEIVYDNMQLKNVEWTNSFKKKLKDKVANNELGSVFQDLANHLSIRDTELFNNLVILQTWFNNVGTSQIRGVISHENYFLNYNQVTQGLLNLIDEVGSPRKSETMAIYKEEISRWANSIEHQI